MTDLFILSTSYAGGGAERIGITLANDLPDSISRLLVAVRGSPERYSTKTEIVTLSSHDASKVMRIIQLPVMIFRYIQLIKKYRPKVSLSLLYEDNLINIIASLLTGVQPIISCHVMPSTVKPFFKKALGDASIHLAKHTRAKFVAVSYALKDSLVQDYGVPAEKISVIYNPIDLAAIARLKDEPVPDDMFDGRYTIITVGRLIEVKGQWHLIRVFAELKKKYLCRLILCGEGPLKGYLMQLSKDLGVEDDVIFLGWCDNPYKYMARADVFVQTSLSEALPNVLVEAMAVGCPVVAANCSKGVEEIIGESGEFCGRMTEALSHNKPPLRSSLDSGEQVLLQNIIMLIIDDNSHKLLSDAGIIRSKRFSKEIQLALYENIIQDTINNSEYVGGYS